MLYAICGNKRHGKDSIADVLVKHHQFRKDSFARPMKEACSIIFGWDLDFMEKHKEDIDPSFGISPRQALMLLGTEFGQHMLCEKYPQFKEITGRKLWAKRVLASYNCQASNKRLVISDLRFPHEAEVVREKGGKIIRVYRYSWPVDLSHESESAVEDVRFDYFIPNNGSLADLEMNVLNLIPV
jgi:hypothetical protein